jgi:site-specific recombinase XerD
MPTRNDFTVHVSSSDQGLRCRLIGPDPQPVCAANDFLRAIARRGLADRTLRTYAYDLLCALRWMHPRHLRPQHLCAEKLLDFVEFQRRQPHATASTLNRRIALLQRFVTFLTGKPLPVAPWQSTASAKSYRRSRASVVRLREEHRVIKPLSDAQALRFFQSLNSWRDRAITVLMWGLGLRCCELLHLTPQDVDWQRMNLRIYGKGRKERVMPLAEALSHPLLQYLTFERPRTADPQLFVVLKGPHRGQAMGYATLRKIFRYHRLTTQITCANPHRFRHTFGANMTRCRVPLAVLSRMMGHASAQTTLRYIELDDEDIRQEYDRAMRALAPGILHA